MTLAIQELRLYGIARRPVVATISLAAALIISIRWWYLVIPTHLLGAFQARWVSTLEMAPTLGGMIAIAAIAPRLPGTDALAVTSRRVTSTAAAVTVAFLGSATAPLAFLLLSMAPEAWVPARENYLLPGEGVLAAIPANALFMITANTVALLGLTLVLVALLGRHLGLGASLAAFVGILLLQSSSLAPYVPLVAGKPYRVTTTALLTALTAIIAGVVIWWRTNAAAPVTRSWRPT